MTFISVSERANPLKKIKLSARLKQQIRDNVLPESAVKAFDMDRILEEEENFLDVDKKKPLALDLEAMKPVIKGTSTAVVQDLSVKE